LLERSLSSIQVPNCPVPSDLLTQILENDAEAGAHAKSSTKRDPVRMREGGRQKLALALSLAAALVLFSLAWWAWPPHPVEVAPVPAAEAEVLSQQVRQCLRNGATPEERINAMTSLADQWLTRTRELLDEPQRLNLLAEHFEKLVQDDLVKEAISLPEARRKAILVPLAERLRQMESDASRLGSQSESSFPRSAQAFRMMAQSSREGSRRLRLLSEGKAI
ncbi:MAG: hypothetical protein ACKO23_19110, partial [Gemmataceae bacterium]